ncbi:MAG: hypothetical protein U5N26_04000 [Candidatus Marinimicrobia bacterium]|nr:hypothetical protein [Candidatus Neomarinimicrobiota bacterium]
MKKSGIISVLLFITVFFSGMLVAQEIEVIAVHFGNPEYAETLRQDDYPGFAFYTTDGSSYYYIEDQKLIGNYNYLRGYYGEVPEKMCFAANYTDDKMRIPHRTGAIFIVGANGVIAGQNTDLNRAVRKVKRGKYEDLAKAKKRRYLKETPIGERAPYRKADINKKGVDWMVGWEVPGITVYDEDWNSHSLNELTKDKNVVLVFYTMDGVQVKRGAKDGTIKEEYYNDKIVHPDDTAEEIAESESPGAFMKSMIKEAASGDDRYARFTAILEAAKSLK